MSVEDERSHEPIAREAKASPARNYTSPDPNVESVCAQLRERSVVGLRKYGTTTVRADINLLGWLQHLQEELLDAAVYVERIKGEMGQQKGCDPRLRYFIHFDEDVMVRGSGDEWEGIWLNQQDKWSGCSFDCGKWPHYREINETAALGLLEKAQAKFNGEIATGGRE